ncbi:MAG TPA: hypothetical protein VHI93_03595 [Candidatus Thermoplasmatota archaeon]|nr:hypothetical protein [Candidatus Thermoplasmatota archaeon]
MTKALAILGIAGAVLAALLASAVSGELVPLGVLLFLLVCAVALFMQRSAFTTILGIVLVLLGLSALLYYNPVVGTEGQVYLPQLPEYFHGAFMPTLVVLGVVALLLAARDGLEPAWTGYVGLAAAALAILLVAFIPSDQFGNFANPLGWGIALLALLLLIPLVALLRSPPATVAPAAPRGTAAPPARAHK